MTRARSSENSSTGLRVSRFLPGRFAVSVAALAVSLAVVVVAVSGVRSAGASDEGIQASLEAIPVSVLDVHYDDSTDVKALYPAVVTARRQSALSFPAGGQLAMIGVDVGDQVEAGAVLAELDVRALNAQRAAAQADLAAARADARLAQATLTRQSQMVARGHASEQVLDQTQASFDAAEARVGAAQATLMALDVQIDLARLTAPYAGVITQRVFDEGASVSPGAPVLTLVEQGMLEVRAGLPADDASRMVVGQLYPLVVNSGDVIQVRLRAVTGVIDPVQRTVEAVFEVAGDAGLPSGTVARLELEHALQERGFWAPVAALSEGRRGLWVIYALTPENEAFILEPRPVEILHAEGDQVYLRGAVSDGQTVLSGGVHRVAPGQLVRPAGEG